MPDSRVTRPLRSAAHRSDTCRISRPSLRRLYAIPVMPDCQGTVNLRPGSKAGERSSGSRYSVTFGWRERSISCTQPSRTNRPHIQSLMTIRSRSVGWWFIRDGLILPKNSSLSLISST